MIFIFNSILMLSSVLKVSADYSYQNPDEWKNENPQCGGSKQSPISVGSVYDIIDNVDNPDSQIMFENYDTLPERMILKNDGHTLKVVYEWADDEEKIPGVEGGPLEAYYILHSIQFRWGADVNSDGSEHKLLEKSFPVEIQLVHYDSNYDNYEDAENFEKGVLIHSSFLKIDSEESEFLTKITEKIPEVVQPGTQTEIEPFSVEILYQTSDAEAFLIYDGSLTYPPCSETIVWMISNKIFPATKEQLQFFHTLELSNGDNHNNRPLQESNDRRPTLTKQFKQ